MKLLVTALAPDIDAPVDPRFGRAAFFIAADSETLGWEAHPNLAANATGGAGTRAAEFVARLKPQAIVSGAFGPNAFAALQAAGIEMYLLRGASTARQVVDALVARKLERADAASGLGGRG